jgi:hypothetical protein
MGDSDDGGGLSPVRRRVRPVGGHPVTHAAKTMLPKLRIILAAVLATCAAVLALSAGMLGTRDPGNDLSGVPEMSRTLVRQAIVAAPDWQQSQLLAYSRRADELLRLRDLPVTPARAVVDYAEHAQARAAETTSAPAAPAAPPTADSATAPAAAASEPAPTTVASIPAATPPTDAPPPAMVAMASVATPHGDTTAATPVEQPASASPAPTMTTAPVTAPPADTASVSLPAVTAPAHTAAIPAPTAAPAETPAAAPAASDDTKVAAVGTGGSETAEMYGPPKPKADGKPRHRARIVHPHPPKAKKKTEVGARAPVGNPRGAPAPSTGFAANQPSNRNNAFGGWRATNDSPPR